MKKILFVGAEAMPFAATGGLGDVLGSLPRAINEAGNGEVDVRVVMPLYGAVSASWREQMEKLYEGEISLSWRKLYCAIYSLVKDGVTYYFIDNESLASSIAIFEHRVPPAPVTTAILFSKSCFIYDYLRIFSLAFS